MVFKFPHQDSTVRLKNRKICAWIPGIRSSPFSSSLIDGGGALLTTTAFSVHSFDQLFLKKGIAEKKEVWAAVGSIVWRIWKCRNDAVFNDKMWRPDEACTTAIREATEFLVANEGGRRPVGAGRVAATEVQIRWRRPMNGWVKINFDGGLDSQTKSSGIGIIIRDSCGRFRAARAIHFGHLMEPVIIEAMVARKSLIFAQEPGMQKVHIEGDSQQVVNMIQRTGDFITSVGVLIVDVNRLKQEFVGMHVSFARRGGNSVAHAVAKNAVRGSGIHSWNPGFSIHFVRMRAPYDVFDFHCFLVLIKSLLNSGKKKKKSCFVLTSMYWNFSSYWNFMNV